MDGVAAQGTRAIRVPLSSTATPARVARRKVGIQRCPATTSAR